MDFEVDLNLTKLRCVQPDESTEEPYLWTFFFQLDGSTVRQVQPNVLQLHGSVKIAAGYGGHSNLNPASCSAGDTPQIPPNVGAHHATLRPIRLQILGQRVVIPGRLLAFCVLMEEDATADGSILKAHAALRDFLEQQWNDFITNQLNQSAVMAEAANLQAANPGLSGRPLMLAAVQGLIDEFIDGLEAPATKVVEDTVYEDSDVFQLLGNLFDRDDTMGNQRLAFDENQIIGAGLHIPIHAPIIRTEDGKWTAYHDLYGNLQATLRAGSNDLNTQIPQPSPPAKLDGGIHVFEQGTLCIPAGTLVEWTLYGSSQEEDIQFTYPFLGVQWTIENQVLSGPQGTVKFNASCGFPRFDVSKPPRLIASESAEKLVTVRYEIDNLEDDGRRLRMWNDPQDGNYSFVVDAIGVAGQGVQIPLGSTMASFDGQRIELGPAEFLAEFDQCWDQMRSVSDRYAKSKKPGPKDLLAPHSRFSIYEDMLRAVDQVAAVRGADQAQISRLKAAIATKLQVLVQGRE
jgi:hypothetical protein